MIAKNALARQASDRMFRERIGEWRAQVMPLVCEGGARRTTAQREQVRETFQDRCGVLGEGAGA